MPEKRSTSETDIRSQLRDVLRHLYEDSYLVQHDIAQALFAEVTPQGFARSRALRRWILDAIEALLPAESTPEIDPVWRPYRILWSRYVESRSSAETMAAIGLAHSQYYEEQNRAVQLLAAAYEQCLETSGERGMSSLAYQGSRSLLSRELESLRGRTSTKEVSLPDILGVVIDTFRGVAAEKGVTISQSYAIESASCRIRANPEILRHLLIQVMGNLLRSVRRGLVVTRHFPEADGIAIVFEVERSAMNATPIIDSSVRELGVAIQTRFDRQDHELVTSIKLWLPARRRLVVVIDNDRDLGQLFRRYLVGQEWGLVASQSATEGLGLVYELMPDAVILDVMMPDGDGWELLPQLHRDRDKHGATLILCSVLAQPELALSLGADIFLAKPVDQFTLLQALHQVELGE